MHMTRLNIKKCKTNFYTFVRERKANLNRLREVIEILANRLTNSHFDIESMMLIFANLLVS